MTIQAFQSTRRGDAVVTPTICVLQVADKNDCTGETIAWIFVERRENQECESNGRPYRASIALHYDCARTNRPGEPLNGGAFSAKYTRSLINNDQSLELVAGALYLDPAPIRGQRIGTYLMNEVVSWASQWPDAMVQPIKLLAGDASPDNLPRRNRFYESFGLVFDYADPEQRQGESRLMPVNQLHANSSWRKNIRVRDPRDLILELDRARRAADEAADRNASYANSLRATVNDASQRPIRWAIRRLWWKISFGQLALLAIATVALAAWLTRK